MASHARTPFIGGNWKMNTSRGQALELAADVARAAAEDAAGPQVAVYPPYVWLETIRAVVGGVSLMLGAQDCSPEPNGARTGDVSLEMLQECGVSTVLIGHSERRHGLHEPQERIAAKLAAVLGRAMTGVLCIGETLEERQAGKTDAVNEAQLRSALTGLAVSDPARLVVAYEPVWAIGTGLAASSDDAQAAHAAIRGVLGSIFGGGPAGEEAAGHIRIIYGGSMKPDNAAELMAKPDVDGGLVGGASLEAQDFIAIVDAARG